MAYHRSKPRYVQRRRHDDIDSYNRACFSCRSLHRIPFQWPSDFSYVPSWPLFLAPAKIKVIYYHLKVAVRQRNAFPRGRRLLQQFPDGEVGAVRVLEH